MERAANLGRILGVQVRLHYSWSVAFLLITGVIFTQFPEAYPPWQRIIVGIAGCLLFFVSMGLREFVLSLMAIKKSIPLRSVTLFVIGGVPRITREYTSPALELLLAATGLLSTLLIAGLFSGIYFLLANAGSVLAAGLIQWLAFIIFMLLLFHFIPAFPLDGGRILRAMHWKWSGDYGQATRVQSWVGWGVGLALVILGILQWVIAHQLFVGLLLTFLGWELQIAATHSRRQVLLYQVLQNVMVRDVMTVECPAVDRQLSVAELVRDYVLVSGGRCFFVVDGDKLQGMVTMRDIKSVPKKRWDSTRLCDIMKPVSDLSTAHPRQPAASLLEQMDALGISRMPVLEEDRVVGTVARDSLLRLLRTRAELRI
ncbi:CBS domain-containing protein [Chloroflexota bacterium]